MKTMIFACLLAFLPVAAHAAFFLNKGELERCALKYAGEKKLASVIGDKCAEPLVSKECRAHGLGRQNVWTDCPFQLISQLKRWAGQKHKSVRAKGGQNAKSADEYVADIGDGKSVCRNYLEGESRVTGFHMDFCRAIVLTQMVGVLHVLDNRK